MNTNSKHYEELNIQPWEIMESNFTTEEFVAYLKGNIIKYTLRDKGQALTDAEKVKHYAEKLIEVIEKKETDGEHKIKVYKPQVKHKFKVGDRIVMDKGSAEELTGIVKRLPTEGYQGREFYIIELDLEGEGWEANRVTHGVDCDNAWYTPEDSLTLLEHEPKKTLKPNKWYDAQTFTVDELKELLAVGTKIKVLADINEDCKHNINYNLEEPKSYKKATVDRVDTYAGDTEVFIEGDDLYYNWFKIIE